MGSCWIISRLNLLCGKLKIISAMKEDQAKSLVKHNLQNFFKFQSESKTASHENHQNNKSEVNSVEEYDAQQTCSTGSPKDSKQEIPEYGCSNAL